MKVDTFAARSTSNGIRMRRRRRCVTWRFAEYLKVSGRFDALVADCPLHYTEKSGPISEPERAVEAGRPGNGASVGSQWRYAHISCAAYRVNPSLWA